jgi:CubicO group peptidase (beta-lactamase class C family)
MRLVSVSLAVAAACLVIACADRPPAASAPSASTDRVDQLFATWNKPDSPGCSVGISRNGATVYEHGYGRANLELGVANTPASVFDVSSVAKQFTAMCILRLVERKQLALDDDVGKYIPDWGERAHRITIRHLLTHTSGLRDGFLLQGLAPQVSDDIHDQIVQMLSRARGFNFAPGSRFEYNNSGFTVLGRIVSRVSGKSLAAFAEENLFKPLGMTHTHFHDDPARIVPNRVTGYVRAANGFRVAVRSYTDAVVGNAGLFTTVGDLLRWEQNLADARVGDPALIAEMQKPAIATGWADSSDYGFGLEIARHRGLRTIGHGGGDEGRRAQVLRYPERGLAIAVACNLEDIDPASLARSIAEIYLADQFPEPPPANANANGAAAPQQPVSLSPQDLQSKAGLYRNVSEGYVGRIFVREGKLMASQDTNESGALELVPIGGNRFTLQGTAIVAEFVPPTAGKPQEVHVTGAGPKPMVSQLLAPFTLSPADLRAFEGVYTSDEVRGTYTIVARDSGLVVQIPTRGEIVLQPVFADAFGGNIFGVATFSRDARGVVTSFTANAPGIRGLRFQRGAR